MTQSHLILNHFLKVDPILYKLAFDFSDPDLFKTNPEEDYFLSLCQSIVNQQLSTLAAATIWKRFIAIFPDATPDPYLLLDIEIEQLRSVGLSQAKCTYLHSVAEAFTRKTIEFNNLETLDDQEIITQLTQIKGVGVWTAEMFLIFTLDRPDVFSLGDRGLMRAIEKAYGVDTTNKQVVEEIILPWSPYRSYAAKILWRSLDNQPN